MDASWQYLITLVVIGLCQQKCYSYDFRCPVQPEWNIRGNAKCGFVLEYFCVLDDNVKKYTEFCKGNPDITRDITWKKGQKSVLRGNLDGEVCSKERYQPFIFRTDGNSDCVYKQSLCQGEGMIIHKNGSKTVDTQCRCDHSKGFAFVSRVKHTCYCIPTQEDCSCSEKHCKKNFKLSSDYTCTSIYSQDNRSPCSGFDTGEWPNDVSVKPKSKKEKTDTFLENDMNKVAIKMIGKRRAILTVAIFTGFCVIIAFIIFFMDGTDKKQAKDLLTVADKTGKKALLGKDTYRHTLYANYRDIVTTIKYSELVEKLDLKKEKKEIYKCLGLMARNDALFEIVISRYDVYKKFIKELRQSNYASLAEKIEKTPESDYKADLTQDEKDKVLCNENIPKDIRGRYSIKITEWYEENTRFTVTSGTIETERMLKQDNCVLVVGRSGKGKSAIIRHLALKLFIEEGFDIVPIVLDPTIIMNYNNLERKQVFVIDDFCGRLDLNTDTKELWSLRINDLLKLTTNNKTEAEIKERKGRVKFLFAVHRDVFDDEGFVCFSSLSRNKVDLSSYPLTNKETQKIASKYNFNAPEEIHPLLNELSAGKTPKQTKEIFTNYDKAIRQDLQKNKHKMCLITLCVLLKFIHEEVYCHDKTPEKEKDVIKTVCSEFAFNVDNKSTVTELKEKLSHLKHTYFLKSGNCYHLVHKIIYDIAATVFGEKMMNIFIQYAPSSLIAERYVFKVKGPNDISTESHLVCIPENTEPISSTVDRDCLKLKGTDVETNLICIPENLEEKYFDRLMSDLKYGITYSTFHNSQLKDEPYRRQFCKYCKDRESEVVIILDQLHKQPSELFQNQNDETGIIKKSNKRYEDYTKFTKPHQFASHKMNIPLIESAWEGNEDIVNLLIEMKCDVNVTDIFRRTALFIACHRGKKDVALRLLKEGASSLLCDVNEVSPLLAACKSGYIYPKLIDMLLKSGADASKCDKDGCYPLHAASMANHKNIVMRILDDKNIENVLQRDNCDRSALFLASSHGRKAVVNILLEHGAKLNERDKDGCTPLIAACSNGKLNVVTELLNNDADISMTDSHGKSALILACEKRELKIVDLLLKKKAIVSQCDLKGRSSLYIACSLGHEQIVNLLLDNKAEISQCDEHGKSPLFIACEKGFETIVDILLKKYDTEAVEQVDNEDRTPLYVASKGGFIGIVKKLVSIGAKVNKSNKWQMTPLLVASREGHCDVVQYLIKRKAELEFAEFNGRTPLSVACDEGNPEVVRILIKSGSIIDHKDEDGNIPLELAKGNKKIENMLKPENIGRKQSLQSLN